VTPNKLLDALRGLIAAPDDPSALARYQAAREAWLAGAHDRAWHQTLLDAASLWDQYLANQERARYDRAIEFYERAQKSDPRDLARLAALARLGELYAQRPGDSRAADLESAIACSAEAARIAEPFRQEEPQPWAAATVNLGHAYLERLRGDPTENIEIALGHYQSALSPALLIADPLIYGRAEQSLAVAYRRRRRGNALQNRQLAMDHALAAEKLLARARYPADWANTQATLGALHWLGLGGDRQAELEQAIARYEEARRVFEQRGDARRQANIADKLGSAYSDRVGGDRRANLEQAMRHYQRALALRRREDYPRDWAKTLHNIAATHADFVFLGQRDHLPQAIESYHQALALRPAELFPADHLQTQRNLGYLLFAEGRFAEAAQALRGGLAASELIYQEAASEEAQQEELRQAAGMPALLAYCRLRAADGASQAALEEAALALEQGRARTWTETLALTTAALADAPDALRRDLAETRRELRELQAQARLPDDLTLPNAALAPTGDFVALSARLRDCRQRLAALIARIQAINPAFLPTPGLREVREAAQRAPLLYLLSTPRGSLALLARCAGPGAPLQIEPLWADAFDSGTLRLIAGRLLGAQQVAPEERTAALQAALDGALPLLGARLIGPLAEALRQRDIKTCALIPFGQLGVLPLHAAPYPGKGRTLCLLDECTLAYAPSARALAAAQWQSRARRGEAIHLVGVGNPQRRDAIPLPHAKAELEGLTLLLRGRADASARPLYGAQASLDALQAALPEATIAHFACHGFFAARSPLDSALLLAEPDALSLRALLAADPAQLARLQLAVLSACQTMLSDVERAPDELIGLPAGFLQAGVPAVIGSLWTVYSESAALLMLRCYELMWEQRLPPVEALCRAQLWLRDLSYAQLDEYAKELWRRGHRALRSPDWDTLAIGCQVMAQQAQERGEAQGRPFANVAHWGAFAYNGAIMDEGGAYGDGGSGAKTA
jgi:CHAT domain-containing protein/tetratricopeptide (TPR) repeat protein